MMKYVYIAFCDEIFFSDIFRTLCGQTENRQTDRQTDIVVYREVTLPKTRTSGLWNPEPPNTELSNKII